MFAVCAGCGSWNPAKEIDPAGPYAICPECDHRHRFVRQPLLILSGASGAGKSTVTQALTGALTNVVVLESDILWAEEFHPREKWPLFFDLWLRMCVNVGQSGRPVLLNGAGFGVPENLAGSVYARYFSRIHILALVCDDEPLAERLRARPAWRKTQDDEFIASQIEFNRWFKEEGPAQDPQIEIYDTTHRSQEETVAYVETWVHGSID